MCLDLGSKGESAGSESGAIWSEESGFYVHCQGKLLEDFRSFKLRLVAAWRMDGRGASVEEERRVRTVPRLSRQELLMVWTQGMAKIRLNICLSTLHILTAITPGSATYWQVTLKRPISSFIKQG